MYEPLWDEIDLPPAQHEAARSKKPEAFDSQPSQQRMRAQVKPADRRNISPSEQKVRRQQARQQSNPKTATTEENAMFVTAATPPWLADRVADPYGTPNKAYDKDKGEYYDHPFWSENPPEVVGRYKIIQKDGLWYGYDTSQNLWTVGFPDKQSVLDMAASPRLDMHANQQHNTQEMNGMDSSTFAQKEAALLQRMATAPTTFEQDTAREALDNLRNARREAQSMDGMLDYDAAMSYTGSGLSTDALPPLSHAQASLGRTAAAIVREGSGDWLDDIPTLSTTSVAERDSAMRTEASLWYSAVHASLRNDREEFSVQARSAAATLARQYVGAEAEAYVTFLDGVDHIHTHAGFSPILREAAPDNGGDTGWLGTDPLAPSPTTPVQDGDHGFGSGSSLPVGVSPSQNPQTADGLVNGDLENASGQTDQKSTDADKAPSLDHGSAPASGTTPSGPDNPIANDSTLDHSTQPGPDNFMQIDGYPSGGTKAGSFFHNPFRRSNPSAGAHAAQPGEVTEMTTSPQAPGQHLPGQHLPGGIHELHSSLEAQTVASLGTGRRITSANDWARSGVESALDEADGLDWLDRFSAASTHVADNAPQAAPNASGQTDPQAPAAYGDAPSMDHGSTPESDTSANAGQVDGHADGDLDKANTEQNPDYVPTGGNASGNPASGGPMQGTPTTNGGTVTGVKALASFVSENAASASFSDNAKTFFTALASCDDLDASIGGVTGRQMVGFITEDASVPDQVKQAFQQAAVVPPFVREADAASCPNCGSSKIGTDDKGGKFCESCGERISAGQRTAGASVAAASNVCPNCKSHMSNVVVKGNTMKATCDNCGWKGTKRKAAADQAPVHQAAGDTMPPGSVRVDATPGHSNHEFTATQIWGPTSGQRVYAGWDHEEAVAAANAAVEAAKTGQWAAECAGARVYDDQSTTASRTAAPRGNDFSLSDAKNEDGEWTMSPEQIRSEMAYDPSEDDDDGYYGSKQAVWDQYRQTAAEWQSPGGYGYQMAEYASNGTVRDLEAFNDAVDQTIDEANRTGQADSIPALEALREHVNSTHEASKVGSRRQAVHLNNVGIEGPGVGTGTAPDGTKVRFHLSPADEASLKSVLYSDMAVNFSGVDITPDEVITEQGGGIRVGRTAAQYLLKQDNVSHQFGLWDQDKGSWYDKDGHDDAVYAAGVPFWKKPKDAQSVADSLNTKTSSVLSSIASAFTS